MLGLVSKTIFLFFSIASQPILYAGAVLDNEPITPIFQQQQLDPSKIALGERLFHDAGLSKDGTVSCSSCHQLSIGGMDSKQFSQGVGGGFGTLNTPTVYNSGLSFSQFWNGRVASLEDQIEGPIHAPNEMASSWSDVIAYLKTDPEYIANFKNIYQALPTAEAIKDAIATFERSLLTPDSPFDRYLRGETDAINEQAKQGYIYFKSFGCASCHQGMAVGGNLYEKLGTLKPYFGVVREAKESDLGRYLVTGKEAHKFEFKVPSLRNVALTAPYLHDGSVDTLEEMVMLMAEYQLGRELTVEQRDDIVAFLKSLTGRLHQCSNDCD